MRGFARALALTIMIAGLGTAARADIDDAKLGEAKAAGDAFLQRAKTAGTPPRDTDPEIAALLQKIYDPAILGAGIVPLTQTGKVIEVMQNGNRVGMVYIFEGTGATDFAATDPKIVARTDENTVTYQPEIGRWLDFELAIEDALVKSALQFLATANDEVMKRPAITSGLAQMRRGLVTSVTGLLKTLTLPGVSDSWRLARISAIDAVADDAVKFLPKPDAAGLADFADRVAAEVQSPEVKARIEAFLGDCGPPEEGLDCPARRAMPTPIEAIVARYRAEPSRTWSLVVTVFGDAIVPRGGSVWLGTLQALLRPLGIEDGALRTAMSRLAADGWLERTRIGRNSFYRLAARGRATFAEATRHIYNQRPPVWDGRLRLVFLDGDADGAGETRAALEAAGFGAVAPSVLAAPATSSMPDLGPDVIAMAAEVEDEAARRLAARAWPLERMAESYRSFAEAFRPLGEAGAPRLTEHDALLGRLLMIHAYRRVALRDPILPNALLPSGWPGEKARVVCARLYGTLLTPSEAWLDRNGQAETGPLPPADLSLRHRFAEKDMLQKSLHAA